MSGGPWSLWRSERGVFLTSSSFWYLPAITDILLSDRCITYISAFAFTWPSPLFLSMSLCPDLLFLQGHQSLDLVWPPLNLTSSIKTSFIGAEGSGLHISCYLVAKSCPTLCDPLDYSQPGSSVHGILQARILEWFAISFSRGSSQPRDWTHVSCIGTVFITVPHGKPYSIFDELQNPDGPFRFRE